MDGKRRDRGVAVDGEKVMRLRKEKGWTQEELAPAADCSPKTVQNAERGERLLPSTVRALATALGVQLKDLLVGTEPPQPDLKGKLKSWVVLDTPFEEFGDGPEVQRVASELQRILGPGHEVIVMAIRKSSTAIEFYADYDASLKLLDAFLEGKLAPLGISKLKMRAIPANDDVFLRSLDANVDSSIDYIEYGSYHFMNLRRARGLGESNPPNEETDPSGS